VNVEWKPLVIGPIPAFLDDCFPELMELDLSYGRLSGTIPVGSGRLSYCTPRHRIPPNKIFKIHFDVVADNGSSRHCLPRYGMPCVDDEAVDEPGKHGPSRHVIGFHSIR
jgi:hypothetical protein